MPCSATEGVARGSQRSEVQGGVLDSESDGEPVLHVLDDTQELLPAKHPGSHGASDSDNCSTDHDADKCAVDSGDSNANIHSFSRNVAILVSMGLSRTLTSIAFSLMVPFFVTVALGKAPDIRDVKYHAEIGLVFAIGRWSELFIVPFITYDLPNIGAKNLFLLSAMTEGGTLLIFAFMDDVKDWHWFIGLCYANRIVMGIAALGYSISAFTLLAGLYQNALGRLDGMTEATAGLGWALGPLLGGVLYDAGGFRVPFLVGGALVIVQSFSLTFILPSDVPIRKSAKSTSQDSSCSGMLPLLQVAWIWIIGITLSLGNLSHTVTEVGLPPFLTETFGSSSTFNGLAMFLLGAVFSLVSPFIGCLADSGVSLAGMGVVGCLICGIGCLLIGPAAFLHMSPHRSYSLISVVLIAVGSNLMMTGSAKHMLDRLHERGLGDVQELRYPVAGITRVFFVVGYCIGSVAGGALRAAIGFEDTFLIVSSLCFAQAGLIGLASLLSAPKRFGQGPDRLQRAWSSNVKTDVLLSMLTHG